MAFCMGVKKLEDRLCGAAVFHVAGEIRKPLQRKCGDTVARRRGVVVARLGTMDEFFVIVAGEEKATVGLIFKLFQQHVCKRLSKG